jgi:3-hydroxyisobutyrate dehydrogenase-like beta-hydroxyacid dehydrogenase
MARTGPTVLEMASGGTVIGFVGTGTMGAPMAGHLVAAGHDVRVFDRSALAMKGVAGAAPTESAAAAAAGGTCVFLSLPGPADVEAAVTGPTGVLAADPLPARVVDLSTNSPAVVRALHARCAAAGVGFVDAPVSGGRIKAESGELSVLVGGTDHDVAAVEPLLQPFAGQVFHVGAPGAGTIAKLVNNQLFLAAAVLVQEAYVFGAAAGLDPSELHNIIRASSGGPYAALAPLLLGRDFDEVIFRLDIAAKDLSLAVEAATANGVAEPVTAAALEVYRDAIGAGLGLKAFHATLLQVERPPGIELPPLTRKPRPG